MIATIAAAEMTGEVIESVPAPEVPRWVAPRGDTTRPKLMMLTKFSGDIEIKTHALTAIDQEIDATRTHTTAVGETDRETVGGHERGM